jgi:hypothetical protein
MLLHAPFISQVILDMGGLGRGGGLPPGNEMPESGRL